MNVWYSGIADLVVKAKKNKRPEVEAKIQNGMCNFFSLFPKEIYN